MRFSTSVFSWISFPQAPEYIIRAVSSFLENSRRYSQLKVHRRCRWHRWQMEKIFNHNRFIIFSGHLWEVELTIDTFLPSSSLTGLSSLIWYRSHYLPPVSLTPAADLPPVSLTLSPVGINNTSEIWRRCRETGVGVHSPPSPAWANFFIIIESTPESGRCRSVLLCGTDDTEAKKNSR
jgi:hypothetical protein